MPFNCLKCNKEYPNTVYPLIKQKDKTVLCDCGGIIVSPSGKVFVKIYIKHECEELIEYNKLDDCQLIQIINSELQYSDADNETANIQVNYCPFCGIKF